MMFVFNILEQDPGREFIRCGGSGLAQYAVKYVLSFPVAGVVVTATAPEELEECAAASDGRPLPRDHLERLEELWRRYGATLSAAPSSGGR
jgi:Predicted oxidoreductases (related to aryl-alcohol dehydrogenases)